MLAEAGQLIEKRPRRRSFPRRCHIWVRNPGHEERHINSALQSLLKPADDHRRTDRLVLDVDRVTRRVYRRDVLLKDATLTVCYWKRIAARRRCIVGVEPTAYRPGDLHSASPAGAEHVLGKRRSSPSNQKPWSCSRSLASFQRWIKL